MIDQKQYLMIQSLVVLVLSLSNPMICSQNCRYRLFLHGKHTGQPLLFQLTSNGSLFAGNMAYFSLPLECLKLNLFIGFFKRPLFKCPNTKLILVVFVTRASSLYQFISVYLKADAPQTIETSSPATIGIPFAFQIANSPLISLTIILDLASVLPSSLVASQTIMPIPLGNKFIVDRCVEGVCGNVRTTFS